MGKVLVIAEKPDAGRNMAKVLKCDNCKDGYIENEKYIVTWAVEVVLCHKCFGFADILIDFTAFHIYLFFKVLYFYFFNNSFSGIAWN